MRFSLTDDQLAFRDAVRHLFSKEFSASALRAAWIAAPGELDRGIWDDLRAMGVLSLLVPEADGGMGLDETYLVPLLEEIGRVALPHPVVETAMVAAPLLGGSVGMASTNLGGPIVPCAADADVLLLKSYGDLIEVSIDCVSLQPVETLDGGRRGAVVSPRKASKSLDRVIDDPKQIKVAFNRGVLGTAAVLVGLSQTMLDLTGTYVAERQQFGRPIGSFQAIKHHLANAALAIEFARPAVWRAAWSMAHQDENHARDASMAKALASDAADLVGRIALQCHGAIGYTVDHDLHLYMKRAWALARAWGDSIHHTDLVNSALESRSHDQFLLPTT